MRYLNRWSISCAWVAAMIAVWSTLAPSVFSASTLVVTTVAGVVLLVGGAMFWETSRPTPSFRQSQVQAETTNSTAGRR